MSLFAPEPAHYGGLEVGALHIWRARMAGAAEHVAAATALLSPDESAQAGRFVFAQDHARYVTTPRTAAGAACARGRRYA